MSRSPRFRKSKLTIATLQVLTGKVVSDEVSAEIWRGLAVHKAVGITTVDKRPVFSITHVVSGKKISPLFFETGDAAKTAAAAFAALPLDWESSDREQFGSPFLKDVIIDISALCGGFVIVSAIDQAGGHA